MKNILAIALVLASVGMFYLLVEPTYQGIKASQLEKVDYDKALNDAEAVRERQAILGSKYNEMAPADVERLEKSIPDSIDNIRLVIEVDKIAQQYSMVLKNTKSREKVASVTSLEFATDQTNTLSSLYGTGELSFTVTGPYEAYIAFIKDLERSLRLTDITAVKLKPVNEDPTKPSAVDLYEFDTTINTYWLKK